MDYPLSPMSFIDYYKSTGGDGVLEFLYKKEKILKQETEEFKRIKADFYDWYKYEADQKTSIENYWLIFKLIKDKSFKFLVNGQRVQPYVYFHHWMKELPETEYKKAYDIFCKHFELNELNINQDWDKKFAELLSIQKTIKWIERYEDGTEEFNDNFEELTRTAKAYPINRLAELLGLELRRSNSSTYQCLCPFHSERTPSFSLHLKTNTFKCYGCGEYGDGIQLVKKYLGLSFRNAVQYITVL